MPLKPSQRIKLIKEIADRLASEGWSLIDLTLGQFGFPTPPTWSGDEHGYLVEHVSKGSDEKLIELGEHVGYQIEIPGGTPISDPPFWRSGLMRVFLSHVSKHRTFALDLQAELLNYGITTFIADKDIKPTTEWQVELETALRTCQALVALLHPGFHASSWTDQEIGYAMGRGTPVFSVRLGQDPYGFIARFQGFNGNGKTPAEIASELFKVYKSHKQTREPIAHALISQFENSDSFAKAKTNIALLEELEYWEPSFSERIESATESNGQIQSSWGVPERVAALVKRWADV